VLILLLVIKTQPSSDLLGVCGCVSKWDIGNLGAINLDPHSENPVLRKPMVSLTKKLNQDFRSCVYYYSIDNHTNKRTGPDPSYYPFLEIAFHFIGFGCKTCELA
jgi:hypothetical protein